GTYDGNSGLCGGQASGTHCDQYFGMTCINGDDIALPFLQRLPNIFQCLTIFGQDPGRHDLCFADETAGSFVAESYILRVQKLLRNFSFGLCSDGNSKDEER